MRVDALDRILAEDPAMAPPPRFAANVMAAVRREATTPPAIAFPWRRALPGILAVGGGLAALLLQALLSGALTSPAGPAPPVAPGAQFLTPALGWAAAAMAGSLLAVRWALRQVEIPG
jgi:hypothetical protein